VGIKLWHEFQGTNHIETIAYILLEERAIQILCPFLDWLFSFHFKEFKDIF
jgi:hypothetical protein